MLKRFSNLLINNSIQTTVVGVDSMLKTLCALSLVDRCDQMRVDKQETISPLVSGIMFEKYFYKAPHIDYLV